MYVGFFAFLIAIGIIVGNILGSSFNDTVQDSVKFDNSSKSMSQFHKNTFVSVMDIGFLVILIGLFLFVIVSSFMIDTHSIFFIFSVILLIVFLVVIAVLGNAFIEFTEQITSSSDFTVIPFVMNNIVMIFLGMGFLVLLSIYIKVKVSG